MNAPAAKAPEYHYDPVNEVVVIRAALYLFLNGHLAEVPEESWNQLATLVRGLKADEFLVKENAALWRAFRHMVDRKLAYDASMLQRLVANEGVQLAPDTLLDLEETAALPENLDWNIITMREDSVCARMLQGPMLKLVGALRNPKRSMDDLTRLLGSMREMTASVGQHSFLVRPDEFSREYKADVAARMATSNFYSFGDDAMDTELVEGTVPGNTGVITGLSGSGKSTYAMSKAIRLAELGRRVLYGCWEMGKTQTMNVMVSMMTRIPLRNVVAGRRGDEVLISPAEVARINNAVNWLTARIQFMENPFFAHQKALRTEARMKGKNYYANNDDNQDLLESYLVRAGCDVAFFDLWDRLLVDWSFQGVTNALNRQKQMHSDYNVFGFILHQINLKEVEKRADKRPQRDDIKGVGAFVEMADLVFGVHRPGQHKDVPDNTIEVMNWKQRLGPGNWCIEYDWKGEIALVENGRKVSYRPGIEAASSESDFDLAKLGSGGRGGPRRRGRA